jgi:hypothetical protein
MPDNDSIIVVVLFCLVFFILSDCTRYLYIKVVKKVVKKSSNDFTCSGLIMDVLP